MSRAQWLNTLKEGDSVIFTNVVYPYFESTCNDIGTYPFIREVTIRNITTDFIITSDGNVFDFDGIHQNAYSVWGGCIVEPTPSLCLLAKQYNTVLTMSCVDWSKVSEETIDKIITLLQEEKYVNPFYTSELPADTGKTFTAVKLRMSEKMLNQQKVNLIQPELIEDDFSDYDEFFDKIFSKHSNSAEQRSIKTYARRKKGKKSNEKK